MDNDPNVTEDDVADISLIDEPSEQATEANSEDTQTETDSQEDKANDEAKDSEAKTEEDSKDTESTEEKPDEKPQEDPKEIARRAYQERQRTRQQVAKQLDQSYGPKTEDQFIEEGLDPAEAKIEALRNEMLYSQQRAEVAELNAGMQADAVNALHDFPVFDENSKDYDPDFTKDVEEAYKVASRLQTDENGIVINAEVPLYDFYQKMYGIYQTGASKGSKQGQAETMAMLSRTENPGGGASKPTGDSLEDLEERLGDVVLT